METPLASIAPSRARSASASARAFLSSASASANASPHRFSFSAVSSRRSAREAMARACIFAPGDTWPILVRGERRDEGEGTLALAPTPAPASSWPSYASDFVAGGVAGSEPAGEREARSGTADEPRATLPRADLGDLGGLLTDASGEGGSSR